MRLTYDLIQRSPVFINPVKDREIDLRGNKIAIIENLATTQDQYDTIDLSDNDIKRIENFPVLNRLKTLFLNNNKVSKIAPGLGESLPHLETLILTNNKLASLSDLDNLAYLKTLKSLSLLENPVTLKNNYRLYEREESKKLYGVLDITKLGSGEDGKAVSDWNKEQAKAISDAISSTTSLADLNKLETALSAGQVPNGSTSSSHQ